MRACVGLRHHRLARLLSAEGHLCLQHGEPIRWVNMPRPDAAQLAGKSLYVYEAWLGDTPYLKDKFDRVERVGEVQRKRGPLVIGNYALV